MAIGVLQLELWAYYSCGYVVSCSYVYYGCGYGCTTAVAMGVSWLQLLANHGKLRAYYSHAAAVRAYQSYRRIICIANMFGHTTATGLLRVRELHSASARSTGDFPFKSFFAYNQLP